MNTKLTWLGLGTMVLVPILAIWLFGASGTSPNTYVEVDGLLSESANEVELVFFGFVGCESVCPSALVRIGEALKQVESASETIRAGATFADINYHRTYELAERYSSAFSPADNTIRGIHLNERQVRELSAVFGLRIVNHTGNLADIQHTDHLFVLRRAADGWILDTILPTSTPASQIKDALLRAASNQSSYHV